MFDHTTERAMRHALTLAARGPRPGVNPQVGCVILSPTGDILAEGWHRGAGTPHAEADALAKLSPGQARGATAIVTLEPCNHTGLTGPCSEALADAGVARVIYSVSDPNPLASGGSDRLRAAGVEVEGGLLADEVGEFMHRWLIAVRTGRPFVTLKWAASLDGRTAAADGTSQWITGAAARQRVHEQRAAHDAIVVGIGTVLADNPSLTARGDAGEFLAEQPIPVVVGKRTIPDDARVLQHPRDVLHFPGHDLEVMLRELFAAGIRSAYVEGGPTLASAFVAAGLVDEYAVYIAPVLIGGPRVAIGDIGASTLGEARRLQLMQIEQLGEDVLMVARPGLDKLEHREGPDHRNGAEQQDEAMKEGN